MYKRQTLVCAIPLGVLLSFGRRSKYKVISWPVSLYISIMRGTPLLLQLLFVYFAPKYMFGLNYDRFLAALIAFVLNYAACLLYTSIRIYSTENKNPTHRSKLREERNDSCLQVL